MSGQINHGFYQFSPTFFYDFFIQNGYDDLNLKIITDNKVSTIYPDMVLPIDFIGEAYIYFRAKKVSKIEISSPIQGDYLNSIPDIKIYDSINKLSIKKLLKKYIPEYFLLRYRIRKMNFKNLRIGKTID